MVNYGSASEVFDILALYKSDYYYYYNCVIAAVTWSYVLTSCRRSAISIPHFTLRVTQFRISPTAVRITVTSTKTACQNGYGTGTRTLDTAFTKQTLTTHYAYLLLSAC